MIHGVVKNYLRYGGLKMGFGTYILMVVQMMNKMNHH